MEQLLKALRSRGFATLFAVLCGKGEGNASQGEELLHNAKARHGAVGQIFLKHDNTQQRYGDARHGTAGAKLPVAYHYEAKVKRTCNSKSKPGNGAVRFSTGGASLRPASPSLTKA